ncbi:MAG: ABC transporter substrate-binding protein [Limnochordia bacterium]
MFKSRLMIVAAVLVLLCGIGVSSSEVTTITHLSTTAHSESWQEFLYEMAGLFEEANPQYKVDIQIGAYEKFLVMIAGGVSPDVLDLPTHGAGSAVADGLFLDLRPYLTRERRLADKFPKPMLDALTSPDGTLFMLPIEAYSIVTWYNLDMLNGAGLTPPAQLGQKWNWDTMREYGRKLTKRNADGSVQVWGLDRVRSRPYIQTVQAGGNFFDRDIFPTQSRILSEPVIAGVEFIEKLIWEDESTQPHGKGGALYTGQAAIDTVDGPGILGTRMRNVGFEWDVAPQPFGPANNATNVSLNGFEISAHSANKEAAWDWVKFIGTTDDAHRRFVRHTGRLSVLREVALRWNTLMPVDLPNNWSVFFEQSVHPNNVYLKEGIVQDDRIMSILQQQLVRIWSGETSTRIALEEADRLIRPLLAQ